MVETLNTLNYATQKNATLHLLLPAPQDWPRHLAALTQLWQPEDQLLLMTAAVQGWQTDTLRAFAQLHPVGVYQPDAISLQLSKPLPAHLQLVSSDVWATWTLHYARCMTWR